MNNIEILKRWIAESSRIVAFTGAGVSTESGIKDFRSPDGLYSENWRPNEQDSTESGIPDFRSVDGLYSQKFDYPPETIISHSFYERNPEYFFRFYREKMLPLGFEPNVTHKVLARWEAEGKLSAVVTQNIDGLHRRRAIKRSMSFTAAFCAITVPAVAGFTRRNSSGTAAGFPSAPAAASSSQTWCSMRKVWIRTPLKRASWPFVRQI